MKNRIYKYIFHEFTRYFSIVLFALTSVIWTIQAVNFLDLVTDDGHAFTVYLLYSFLVLPKMLTKLIPFSFLIATLLTVYKFEKDNELLILWTSGLNKIYIVNLIFRISLLVMFIQFLMASLITPETLHVSRALIKNSELQFMPSLLKEKEFNDTVEGLTVFVDKKNIDGTYENIFIRDDKNILTKISSGSATIFAKKGFISNDKKNLVLLDGNIQKSEGNKFADIIVFQRTQLKITGLATKTISEPKIQETSTIKILHCLLGKNIIEYNCPHKNQRKDSKIEINKRFGMPIYIPLIALIACFVLSSRRDRKNYSLNKYICFIIGILILIGSEITVRYSGISLNHTFVYYSIPIVLFPLVYFTLTKTFKYENLH